MARRFFTKIKRSQRVKSTNLRDGGKSDAVNLAGRQKMLNQQLMKEVFTKKFGQQIDISITFDMILQTVDALINGGEVLINSESNPVKIIMKPAPTNDIAIKFKDQISAIHKVMDCGQNFLQQDKDPKASLAALQEMLEAGEYFHAIANEGLTILEDHFSKEKAEEKEQKEQLQDILKTNANETAIRSKIAETATSDIHNNMYTIASVTEEMNATIKEISVNTDKAAEISNNAVERAQKTKKIVEQLGDNTKKIGNVIQLITAIASQTKLLALNATIEAARAGDAGKGFSVVASEVKQFAKETAKATKDIADEIKVMLQDTKEVVRAMDGIGNVVESINELSGMIAYAVSEQASASEEMAMNLSEAVSHTDTVTSNIAELASFAEKTYQTAEEVSELN